MREKLTKALKIALAALLVFLVAAPLIVGVYDATRGNNQNGDRGIVSKGILQTVSRSTGSVFDNTDHGTFLDASSPIQWEDSEFHERGLSEKLCSEYPEINGFNLRSAGSSLYKGASPRLEWATYPGLDVSEESGSDIIHFESEVAEEYPTISDWYSGDPRAADLLGSGKLHLVYEFADGSTVDYGNPYVLNWSDVPQPDDYEQVVYGDGETSLFAPEKAYAGPISWLSAKLKHLAVKSGYWKSFNSMVYSMAITICMSSGMNYAAATQCVNKVVAELPAITRVITSETAAFSTEDTAMLVANSISRVAARKVAASEFPAALNAEIAANVTSVETTGMLAGGTSGNFVNAMYQLAATGGIPTSILYSDIGLYIGSWLGGNFDDYFTDVPTYDPDIGVESVLSFNGHDYNVTITHDALSGSDAGFQQFNRDFLGQYYYGGYLYSFVPSGFAVHADGTLTCKLGSSTKMVWLDDQAKWVMVDSQASKDAGAYDARKLDGDFSDVHLYLAPNAASFYKDSVTYNNQIAYCDSSGTWHVVADGVTITDAASGSLEAPQVIGADAKYDEAGNIVDYGNVTVPNVFAPDYVAPGSFAEALDQMNATATTESPAHADSPAFGQDGTVKDWTDANKPVEPEPGDSSQDDFKVEDLEKVFPFCIPWDVYYLLSALSAEPVAPRIDFPLNFSNFGLDDYSLTVDFADYESFAVVIRAVEALSFCVGLALVTRNLIRG